MKNRFDVSRCCCGGIGWDGYYCSRHSTSEPNIAQIKGSQVAWSAIAGNGIEGSTQIPLAIGYDPIADEAVTLNTKLVNAPDGTETFINVQRYNARTGERTFDGQSGIPQDVFSGGGLFSLSGDGSLIGTTYQTSFFWNDATVHIVFIDSKTASLTGDISLDAFTYRLHDLQFDNENNLVCLMSSDPPGFAGLSPFLRSYSSGGNENSTVDIPVVNEGASNLFSTPERLILSPDGSAYATIRETYIIPFVGHRTGVWIHKIDGGGIVNAGANWPRPVTGGVHLAWQALTSDALRRNLTDLSSRVFIWGNPSGFYNPDGTVSSTFGSTFDRILTAHIDRSNRIFYLNDRGDMEWFPTAGESAGGRVSPASLGLAQGAPSSYDTCALVGEGVPHQS